MAFSTSNPNSQVINMFRTFLSTKGYTDNTTNEYAYLVNRVFDERYIRNANNLSIPEITALVEEYGGPMYPRQGHVGGRAVLYGEYGNDAVLNALIQYREFRLIRAYRDHLIHALVDGETDLNMNEIGECVEIMKQVCESSRERLFVLGRGVGRFLFNEARPIRNRAIHEFMRFVDLHPTWFAARNGAV